MNRKAAVAVALVTSLGVTGFLLRLILNIVSLTVWLTVTAIKIVVFLAIAAVVFFAVYSWLKHKAKPR